MIITNLYPPTLLFQELMSAHSFARFYLGERAAGSASHLLVDFDGAFDHVGMCVQYRIADRLDILSGLRVKLQIHLSGLPYEVGIFHNLIESISKCRNALERNLPGSEKRAPDCRTCAHELRNLFADGIGDRFLH